MDANTISGRLHFLDTTLERIIQRFEDEYPETKLPTPAPAKEPGDASSLNSSLAEPSTISSVTEDPVSKVNSEEYVEPGDLETEEHPYAVKLSRSSSNTSLRTRALDHEEGRMHRFGQQIRREILRPEGLDYAHGTDGTTVDPPHIAVLRAKLESYRGDELRRAVMDHGFDKLLEELGADASALAELEITDPEDFQKLKEAQLAAQANIGTHGLEVGNIKDGHDVQPSDTASSKETSTAYDAATKT